MKHLPSSHDCSRLGSRGMLPRKGAFMSALIWRAPPVTAGKMSDEICAQNAMG